MPWLLDGVTVVVTDIPAKAVVAANKSVMRHASEAPYLIILSSSLI
jgi:riboflavin biosynthesis pyrimidine reductase